MNQQDNPATPEVQLQSALTLWKIGEITAQQASDIFQTVSTQIHPSPHWLRTTSKALLEARQLEPALFYANQAIALDPLAYESHWQKTQCLIAQKDFAAAEQTLNAAEPLLTTGPAENAYTHHHVLAQILAKRGRLEEAVAAERTSLQNQPEYFDSFYNLACLLWELERYQDALPMFNQALRLAGPHEHEVEQHIKSLENTLAAQAKHAARSHFPDPKTLGYSYNNGGLNNQKFALLGLITDAYSKKQPILLPNMIIVDNVTNTRTQIPMDQAFDLAPLFDFFNKYGITIIPGSPAHLPPDPQGFYLGKGATRCGTLATGEISDPALAALIADYFRSLIPRVKKSYLMKNLIEDIFIRNGIEIAAQFRIETDWERYCNTTLNALLTEPEDYRLTFDQIAAKITRTFPDTRKILVLCDESAIPTPKHKMTEICHEIFGITLFWKSDFLTSFELAKLNNLELSMIDFELALCAKHYVGMTRSTFSNALTSTKYILTGAPITSDYIYNPPAPHLTRRTDNGGSLSIKFAEHSGSLEQT